MMENAKNREVEITYSLPFPRNKVFKAWTEPEHLTKWFAPDGCTIEFVSLQIREGGKFHSCVHTPLYGDCWCVGEYLEIIQDEKIVYRICNSNAKGELLEPADAGKDAGWPVESIVTVVFSEQNSITTINLKQTVPEELAKKTGAYQSWLQMLDGLQSQLACMR